jgi:hypothetical protein
MYNHPSHWAIPSSSSWFTPHAHLHVQQLCQLVESPVQVVTELHEVLNVKHTGEVQVKQLKELRLS